MRISICIPVYNFDIRPLVRHLHNEIISFGLDVEIILADDASTTDFRETNREVAPLVQKNILLSKNVGRSRIRNFLAQEASGDYLLFLDCDSRIEHSDFVRKYIHYIEMYKEAPIFYGGRIVLEKPSFPEYKLRWKFAKERECLPLAQRKKRPYLTFQTNNFLIKKSIFEKNKFKEILSQYGYEDVVFAYDLKKTGIEITHVDNAVINADIEGNTVYMEKVETSVRNIKLLLEKYPETVAEIKLVKIYTFLKQRKIDVVYRYFFSRWKFQIKQRLLQSGGPLRLLDIYKLGLLLEK